MDEASNISLWQTKNPQQLLSAITALADTSDLPNFLSDLLTKKEIIEIAARFEAALLLNDGVSYQTIVTQTKLSTRTVARISQWLKNGTGGYIAALTALNNQPAHHSHIPPARAE